MRDESGTAKEPLQLPGKCHNVKFETFDSRVIFNLDKGMWSVLSGLRTDLRPGHNHHHRHTHEPTADTARMRLHAEDAYLHLLLSPTSGPRIHRRR